MFTAKTLLYYHTLLQTKRIKNLLNYTVLVASKYIDQSENGTKVSMGLTLEPHFVHYFFSRSPPLSQNSSLRNIYRKFMDFGPIQIHTHMRQNRLETGGSGGKSNQRKRENQ